LGRARAFFPRSKIKEDDSMANRSLMPWGRESSTAPTAWRDEDRSPFVGFRRDVERLFDEMLTSALPGFGAGRAIAWPNVEVSESDSEIRISAEVPGMSDKDVELLVDDGVLTIHGERKSETEDKDRGYSERYYGRFERRIALPRGVDEEKAKADFRDGMLTVTLPKSAEAERGRRIPIGAETSK
jgi:HSP20 family protein